MHMRNTRSTTTARTSFFLVITTTITVQLPRSQLQRRHMTYFPPQQTLTTQLQLHITLLPLPIKDFTISPQHTVVCIVFILGTFFT
jgi:hypothetical protein